MLIVIVALPLALVVKEVAAGIGGRGAARIDVRRLAPIRDVLRQPAFYLLMIGSMCSIAAVGGANQHLKLYLSLDHGYTQAAAAGSRRSRSRRVSWDAWRWAGSPTGGRRSA